MVTTRANSNRQKTQPLRRRRSCTIHTLIGKTEISTDVSQLPKPIPEELELDQTAQAIPEASGTDTENQPAEDNNSKSSSRPRSSKARRASKSSRKGKRKFADVSDACDAAQGSASKRFKDLEQKLQLAEAKCCDIEKRSSEWQKQAEKLSKEREKVLATQETLQASVKAQKVARAALEVHNEWLERQNNSIKSKVASSTELNVLQSSVSTLEAKVGMLLEDLVQERLEKAAALEKVRFLIEELDQSHTTRRSIHEELMTLRGNIRVYCRVRPRLSKSDETGFNYIDDGETTQSLMVQSEMSSSVDGRTESRKTWKFAFDRVFDETCTQSDVFSEVSGLVQSVLDGHNGCIFAYGQTGSGKTHTMLGDLKSTDQRGLIPRAIDFMFAQRKKMEELNIDNLEFSVSFLEIYNEKLQDLLSSKKSKLQIRHGEDGVTNVRGLTSVKVDSASEVLELLGQATLKRSTAKTNLNKRSSRSHSVFSITIESAGATRNVLHLIDLAGSERLNQSGANKDKKLLKETQAINKSLSSLGNVISSLVQGGESAHVPYRDSKLTYLLQNALGGSCKTLMLTNLSPELQFLNESICTLRFAEKSAKVTSK